MRKLESKSPGAATPLAIYRVLTQRTQAQIASAASIRRATVSDIETGKQQPRPSTARAIAAALGMNPPAVFPDLDWSREDNP